MRADDDITLARCLIFKYTPGCGLGSTVARTVGVIRAGSLVPLVLVPIVRTGDVVGGRRMMEAFLQLIDFMPHGKVLGNIVRSQVEKELIAYRIRACYEPSLRLDRDTVPVEEAPTEEAAETSSEPTSSTIPTAAKRAIPILKKKP